MATLIDGRAVAHEILAEARQAVSSFGRTPRVHAIVVQPTPATESYLRIKSAKAQEAGMALEVVRLPDTADEGALAKASADSRADALIVQLPLPEGIDEHAVLDALPLEKDADVLSAAAYARFLSGDPEALMPPVVGAVIEVLLRAEMTIAGKRAFVVGEGRLVGQPVAAWISGEDANVTTTTRETFVDNLEALKAADIVISGAGAPHLIKPSMLKKGVVVIDAGTSESGGAIVGDFDPACADVASVFTPVPGGVGPIAVACLFKNVAQLLSKRS